MQTVINRTEGWITGLVLAISVLTQYEDRSLFLSAFTGAHPLLQEFFIENVPAFKYRWDVQTFMLKTSILKN